MSTHKRFTTAAGGADSAIQPNARGARVSARTGLTIPALLLFASGTAALVYQVLWIKQLSLVVGVDVYAVTTGVSAFFAGLALGSTLFGRWADRLARPCLLYALLELGVAVLGVATTLALARAAPPFAVLEARAGPLAWALLFAFVGMPAVLMGGTLPVLIRSRAPQPGADRAGGRPFGYFRSYAQGLQRPAVLETTAQRQDADHYTFASSTSPGMAVSMVNAGARYPVTFAAVGGDPDVAEWCKKGCQSGNKWMSLTMVALFATIGYELEHKTLSNVVCDF